MKWFKHDANASIDAKLKRIRIKYGMEGYGLYWYCLELIAKNVEKHNLTFSLEEDSELISCDTGIHQERVEEMMVHMVNLGLFEQSGTHITCLKMATRADEYTAKLLRTANIPILSGHSPDKVPPNRIDRREEKRQAGGAFTLSDDWKPDQILWEGKSFQAGIPMADYKSCLTEFICHYQGNSPQTEVYWIGKLIAWIKRDSSRNPKKLNTGSERDELFL